MTTHQFFPACPPFVNTVYGHSLADLAKQRTMNSLELPPRSVERVVLESSFWTIMATAGFLGNILVCIAFYRNPVLRKITPIYIVALAITDILNFLTNGIFVEVTLITGGWQFGDAGCFVGAFSSIFLVYASISTMSLIAINRYIRVTRPGLFQSLFATTPSILIVVCLWFIESMIVLLPFVIGRTKFLFNSGYAVCVPSFQDKFTIYTMITHVSFITASLLIVPACYYKVHRALKQVSAQVPQISQQLQVGLAAEEAQSAQQEEDQANQQPEEDPEAIIQLKEESKVACQQGSVSLNKKCPPPKNGMPHLQEPQGVRSPQEDVRYSKRKATKKVQTTHPQERRPPNAPGNKRRKTLDKSHPQEQTATNHQNDLQESYQQHIPQNTHRDQAPKQEPQAQQLPKSPNYKRKGPLSNQLEFPAQDTYRAQVPQGTRKGNENKETQPEEQPAFQRANEPHVGHDGESVLKAKEVKITKMMFAIVLAFTLIWIPLFCIVLLTRITLGTLPRDVVMLVSYGVNFSSLINPVLYAVVNRSYRKEFKFILWNIIFYFSDCLERCECGCM